MKLKYDLHLHSCLSPCGDGEMTPYNLVNLAKLLGYDIIALTDHNSCLNCPSAMEVGRQIGLTVVPGMELCTAEEIHCVCLLPDLDRALAFSERIHQLLPPVKNREKIFGEQLVMDAEDHTIGREELLLTAACAVSIEEVPSLMEEYGGVCYPAHIDRSSYSVLSVLGDFPAGLPVSCYELTCAANEKAYLEQYEILRSKKLIKSSDAHYLENMTEARFTVDLTENTPAALIEYLKG